MTTTGATSCLNSHILSTFVTDISITYSSRTYGLLVCCRESASWDLKLALAYKDLKRRIISSIVTSCTSGLALLDS